MFNQFKRKKMKVLAKTIFLILVASAMYGQELTGHWNGTLDVQGTKLRVIFHVIKTNDEIKATMDSPDQNASGIPVTKVDFNIPNLTFKISNLDMVYEGVLSGNLIKGRWVQSGQTFLLDLFKMEDLPTK
jgi:uncharacterized protein